MAEAVKENNNYIRIPYEFLSKGLTAVALLILGKIFTFSNLPKAQDSVCRSSFRRFSNDFRISERQIARKVKELKADKVVIQDKGQSSCATYTYAGEKCGRGFIRSELYLYQKEFEIHQEGKRYLTLSEILVLSVIMTHCNNPETGKYTGSIRGMAKLLGLSSSTVQRCIDVLKRANLIICEAKAPNGSRWSAYRINEKHLKTAEREYKKTVKKASYVDPKVAAVDAKTDRERFYATMKARAEAPAEQAQERLRTDEKYRDAERALNGLNKPQAEAEINDDTAEQERIRKEQTRWKAMMRKRMAALNITPEDLKPRYRCVKCSDTGWRPDGHQCDCYPLKGGRT